MELHGSDAGSEVSQLFAVDGAFDWYAGPWSACNGSCSGEGFIFRHRQVGSTQMCDIDIDFTVSDDKNREVR